MALVPCGLTAYPPSDRLMDSPRVNASEARLESATVRVTHTFMAPTGMAGTPVAQLVVGVGLVDAAGPIRVRLETDAGGVPSGTLAWPGAEGVANPLGAWLMTIIPLDAAGGMTPGALHHAVFSLAGGTGSLYLKRTSQLGETTLPSILRSTDSGASWTANKGELAVLAITPNSRMWALGHNTFPFGSVTYKASSAVDEYGMRIPSLPSRVRVVGVRVHASLDTNGQAVARLYHPGGSVASSPISWRSMPYSSGADCQISFAFPEPVELPAGSDVRMTLHATGTGNVVIRYVDVGEPYDDVSPIPGFTGTRRKHGNAWEDPFAPKYFMSLLIDRIDDGTGDGVYPVPADVLNGVAYGPTGELTGEAALPPAGAVRTGTFFGASPPVGGTLVLPVASDVRQGVGYGAGGTEMSGTLAGGSGSGSGGVVFHPGMSGGFNG